MRKRHFCYLLLLIVITNLLLTSCGGAVQQENQANKNESERKSFSIAMVTDTGGVDDKSFNQSAWEGIQQFGKEQGLERGNDGYDYLQSESDADYNTNLNNLIRRDFDVIYAVGALFEGSVAEIAKQRPEANLVIVDGEVQADNVASILFKDNEGAFLAGIAAALHTKTNKVGFIGGMKLPVIERFETGFRAGVKAIDPQIEVMINYAGAFDKAELGKAAANQMYTSGADIIFHASGATGNGVFNEAKERKQADPDANVWVIGVDRDQYEEGKVGEHNVTLTSALKLVNVGVIDVANEAMAGNFPGGKVLTYGLAEDSIGLADSRGALSEDILEQVDDWQERIKAGEIDVPKNYEQLESFSIK